jgi:hypothetical protein
MNTSVWPTTGFGQTVVLTPFFDDLQEDTVGTVVFPQIWVIVLLNNK